MEIWIKCDVCKNKNKCDKNLSVCKNFEFKK
jgi:hypothetical protein